MSFSRAGGSIGRLYVDAFTTQRLLQAVRKILLAHAAAPARARRLTMPILARMLRTAHRVEKDLEDLRVLGSLRVSGDEGAFAELLSRIAHLPVGERAFVRLQLMEMWRWLHIDDEADGLAEQVRKSRENFVDYIRKAKAALKMGRVGLAVRFLARAHGESARMCELSVRIGIAVSRYKQEAARIVTRAALLSVPQVQVAG